MLSTDNPATEPKPSLWRRFLRCLNPFLYQPWFREVAETETTPDVAVHESRKDIDVSWGAPPIDLQLEGQDLIEEMERLTYERANPAFLRIKALMAEHGIEIVWKAKFHGPDFSGDGILFELTRQIESDASDKTKLTGELMQSTDEPTSHTPGTLTASIPDPPMGIEERELPLQAAKRLRRIAAAKQSWETRRLKAKKLQREVAAAARIAEAKAEERRVAREAKRRQTAKKQPTAKAKVKPKTGKK